jgi:hypothetical protein
MTCSLVPPAELYFHSSSSALLIVEHYIEKRTADLQPAVVVDKKKFSELIHEKVDAAASSRHQFRQQAGYGHVTRRR